jgi:hypothetical protein
MFRHWRSGGDPQLDGNTAMARLYRKSRRGAAENEFDGLQRIERHAHDGRTSINLLSRL